MKDMEKLQNWLKIIVKKADFNVQSIGLNESQEWKLENGSIKHKTGRFFKIIGIRWIGKNGLICEQPFIEQKEIGTLGFLLRENNGKNQLLVQAKIEPGNIGVAQFAPTCQATKSNSNCFHGGTPPPYRDYFNKIKTSNIYDKMQSEQGSRFFGKRNRNVLMKIQSKIPVLQSHKWIEVDDVLALLKKDFLFNTDARSVLVCSPWNELVNREPFSKFKNGFGFELFKSLNTQCDFLRIKKIKNEIKLLRNKSQKSKKINLKKIKGWNFNKKGITPNLKGSFIVEQIKVVVKGREVSSWDQPIVNSFSKGEISLVCGRRNGILYFLFKAEDEIGLYNKVELTPTIVFEPGLNLTNKINKSKISKGKIKIKCQQSEEGGRFFQDINIFSIIDVGDSYKESKNHFWLNLREIRKLLDEEGWFTNEARSVLSLLLPWM